MYKRQPIDSAKRPDLTPLIKASQALGQVLKRGDTVVYESTVYPVSYTHLDVYKRQHHCLVVP